MSTESRQTLIRPWLGSRPSHTSRTPTSGTGLARDTSMPFVRGGVDVCGRRRSVLTFWRVGERHWGRRPTLRTERCRRDVPTGRRPSGCAKSQATSRKPVGARSECCPGLSTRPRSACKGATFVACHPVDTDAASVAIAPGGRAGRSPQTAWLRALHIRLRAWCRRRTITVADGGVDGRSCRALTRMAIGRRNYVETIDMSVSSADRCWSSGSPVRRHPHLRISLRAWWATGSARDPGRLVASDAGWSDCRDKRRKAKVPWVNRCSG